MREVVTALRGLLADETVTLDGTHVHLDGVELDYVYQERRPKQVPIYVGATGMQMMELAGEIADGVVLNYLVDPSYNVEAMAALERGAAKAGRTLADIDRPQLVVCSIDRDRKAALDGARLMVTQYLGQQPHIMKASGVPQELLDEIGRVLTWPATHEQVDAASRLVPDEVVQRCTASGEPDEVVAKVGEYVANGCTCPILYPLGPDVGLMLDTFKHAMIEIRSLTKRFGKVVAVDDLSFDVQPGPGDRLPRPERVRQEHDDALHGRPRPARRRHDDVRRTPLRVVPPPAVRGRRAARRRLRAPGSFRSQPPALARRQQRRAVEARSTRCSAWSA